MYFDHIHPITSLLDALFFSNIPQSNLYNVYTYLSTCMHARMCVYS